jgi:hypothetical protein
MMTATAKAIASLTVMKTGIGGNVQLPIVGSLQKGQQRGCSEMGKTKNRATEMLQ